MNNKFLFLRPMLTKIAYQKTFIFLVLLFALVFGFNCQLAQAAETRSGDAVSVGANQTIDDDLYVAGGTISINGQINGDLIVAGGTVSINGSIRDDLVVLGGNVTINGSIGQSIRVAGGNVVVSSTVGNDIIAAGGTVDVTSEATVKKDVMLSGGNINLNGIVERDLQGAAGMIAIGGTINGDTTLTAGQLTLSKNAKLGGNLTYTSENKAKIEPGAMVSGKTTHSQPPVEKRKPTPSQRAVGTLVYFIISFLAAYLFGALLLAILPTQTREIADTVLTRPWASLGIGFLALVIIPIAAIILLFFIITIPISITIFLLYLLALYLAQVFAGLALGRLVFKYFKWPGNDYLVLFVGLLLLMLIALIPIIGWLVKFLYMLFGLGAIVIAIYDMIENRRRTAVALTNPVVEPSQPEAGPE
jgi:cytoskeletal protein CcmA (bactofilin family)